MTDTLDPAVYTQWLEQLRTDLAESVNGVVLRGSRVVPVGTGGTVRPANMPGTLLGFGIRNTAAGPTTVILRDGEDGDIVVPITLSLGESVRDWFGPGGLNLVNGLFVDIVGGSIDGAVYLRGPQ